MPSLWHNILHTADVNCTPRSVVMMAGTPNREIHPATKASAQSVAVVEVRGSHDMCVAFRAGSKRSHQVHMEMGETVGRYRDGLDRCCWLCSNFGPLAFSTVTTPAADICRHAFPHKPGRHKASGGPDARVGQCVYGREHFLPPGNGH